MKNIFYCLILGSNVFFCSNYCCDTSGEKRSFVNPRVRQIIDQERDSRLEILRSMSVSVTPIIRKKITLPKKAIEHAQERAPWAANQSSKTTKKVSSILGMLSESSGKYEDEEE